MRAGLISAIIDRSTQSVQCFMCKLRKTSSSFVEKELAAILGSRRCRCDRSYQCSPLTDLTDLELAQHTSPQVQWALGRQRGPSLYQHGRGEVCPVLGLPSTVVAGRIARGHLLLGTAPQLQTEQGSASDVDLSYLSRTCAGVGGAWCNSRATSSHVIPDRLREVGTMDFGESDANRRQTLSSICGTSTWPGQPEETCLCAIAVLACDSGVCHV